MGELTALVVVMVAAGYAFRRSGVVRAEGARAINQVVLYLLLPPLVFLALQRAKLTWSLLLMPTFAWGLAFAGVGLGLALARLLRLDRPTAGAFVLAMVFGNTTYFGYPVIEGYYGPHHLTLAIFYDLLGATIAVNSLGVSLASALGDRAVHLREILLRLARFPAIWALGLGLAFNGVALPALLESTLQRLAGLTAPAIMFSIGVSLRLSAWREDLPLVAIAAVGKLLVLPLLVLGVAAGVRLPLDFRQVAVMQAAMPTMFYSLSLALLFRLRVNLVVNAILVTVVLSFATLPLWRCVLAP